MTVPRFTVLNSAKFPIITIERSRLVSSGTEAMISDFEALLAGNHSFALLMAGDRNSDPTHDDQKRWMLWLKENRGRMAMFCRGVVSVVDATGDLALQQKQAAGMQAMLGIPVKLAENAEEADRIAAELLD